MTVIAAQLPLSEGVLWTELIFFGSYITRGADRITYNG